MPTVKYVDLNGLDHFKDKIESKIPSAGTTTQAVGTSSSGGSASTYSKSDHVHNITDTTITSALGYTPYNSTNPNGYTSNTGTITGVKMNGSTIASSGVADLGTVITSHQSIKTINSTSLVGTGNVSVQPTLVSGTNIKTINSQSLLGSGDITISGGTPNEYSLTSILSMTSTSDSAYAVVNDIINNKPFIIYHDPDGRAREVYIYIPIKEYADSGQTNQSFWYIDYQDKYNKVQIVNSSGTSVSVTQTTYHSIEEAYNLANGKQDALVSGTNIKTINSSSILGSGNLTLEDSTNKVTSISSSSTDTQYPSAKCVYNAIGNHHDSTKQDTLVSGTNIKTINNQSILGSGNITISGGGDITDVKINNTSIVSSGIANIVTKTAYNSSTNKIATESDIPDVSSKLDTSKVKTSASTTSGDVYDVTYINSLIGDINSALDSINGEVI